MWRTLLSSMVTNHGADLMKRIITRCSSSKPNVKFNKQKTSKSEECVTIIQPHVNKGLSAFLKDGSGEYSTMRLMIVLMILMLFGLRIWGCIIEQRYIPWDWPEVSLLSACLGGKALQSKYEGTTIDVNEFDIKPSRSKYSSGD